MGDALKHWRHKWSNWSDVKQDRGEFWSGNPYQDRMCKVCRLVRRRYP